MSDPALNLITTRSCVPTVASRYDVSESTVWRFIRAGRLTARKPSPGITLIDDAEAERVFAGEVA